MDKYELKIEEAWDSSEIVWSSFVKSKPKLCCSFFVHVFIKLIIWLFGLYLIWAIERFISKLDSEYPIYHIQSPAPPNQFISLTRALDDHYKGQQKQFKEFDTQIKQGLLSAYCYEQTNFNKSVSA